MTLLDEEALRWYCSKDDRVYYATENRWEGGTSRTVQRETEHRKTYLVIAAAYAAAFTIGYLLALMLGILSWGIIPVITILTGLLVFVCFSVTILGRGSVKLLSNVPLYLSFLMALIGVSQVLVAVAQFNAALTVCNLETETTCSSGTSAYSPYNGVILIDMGTYYHALIVQGAILLFTIILVLFSVIHFFRENRAEPKKNLKEDLIVKTGELKWTQD